MKPQFASRLFWQRSSTKSLPHRYVYYSNKGRLTNFYRRYLFSPPPSSVVENSGSIARDILATERTFLAWSRTGLGFVGAGSALFAAYHRQELAESPRNQQADDTKAFLYTHIVPACALLMANGAFLLMFATSRYLTVISALQRHKFPIDIRGTLAAVVLTAMSTVTSLGLIANAEWKQIQPDKGEKEPAEE